MKPMYKFLLLVFLVVAGILVANLTPIAHWFKGDELATIIQRLRSTPWSIPVFLCIYITGSLLALPSFGMSVLGGVVFGFFPGIVFNLIGCNLGAWASFGISRYLGREYVKGVIKNDKIKKFETLIIEKGWKFIVAIRIAPILPYNAVNYMSAWVGLTFREYAIGTAIGTVPATLLFTYYAQAAAGSGSPAIRWKVFLWTLMIASVLIALYWLKRQSKSKR